MTGLWEWMLIDKRAHIPAVGGCEPTNRVSSLKVVFFNIF